jgi:hypothetical protein
MAHDEYMQEFDMVENDRQLQAASMGIEAERFLRSKLGKYILERVEQEIEEGYKALSIADPDSPGSIRHHQFNIAVARTVPQWLAAVIRDGRAAEAAIREEEGEYQ